MARSRSGRGHPAKHELHPGLLRRCLAMTRVIAFVINRGVTVTMSITLTSWRGRTAAASIQRNSNTPWIASALPRNDEGNHLCYK